LLAVALLVGLFFALDLAASRNREPCVRAQDSLQTCFSAPLLAGSLIYAAVLMAVTGLSLAWRGVL